MATIQSIVWGVRDITRAVEFWTAALDYVPKREPDDDWASLVPREGEGVQLSLMLVGSEKPQRHHLDIQADDRANQTMACLTFAALACITIVLRSLLRNAIVMRSELDEVV